MLTRADGAVGWVIGLCLAFTTLGKGIRLLRRALAPLAVGGIVCVGGQHEPKELSKKYYTALRIAISTKGHKEQRSSTARRPVRRPLHAHRLPLLTFTRTLSDHPIQYAQECHRGIQHMTGAMHTIMSERVIATTCPPIHCTSGRHRWLGWL
ncbi:Uncharacterised protein [Mycobacteroides abscessus subsp. massiliense]|nr:Uncharacterised protein [Mycobacteroides abscessus subsp. massiliense]SLD01486.1 Uncharacterised protein [Mycobacteroides abscessus subsp. massiliense]